MFFETQCILCSIVQLLLDFQGLAQDCESDNAVVSQRLKSLASELQGVVEKQLQTTTGSMLQRAKKQCSAVFDDKVGDVFPSFLSTFCVSCSVWNSLPVHFCGCLSVRYNRKKCQHFFRGCQSSATSFPLTSGKWLQQINFSVRSSLQPLHCPWYQTLSPILKSALHQDVQYGSRNHNRKQCTTTKMDWRVDCFRCSKPLIDRGPFHCTSWIRRTSTLVVNVEPLSHWPGSMCSQPHPLESGFRFILFLWHIFTNYVTHCERLSRYEISRRFLSLTFGWWGSYCLALHAEHMLRK